jgi:hypothetical protein
MTLLWKVLLALVLVLPLGAYVAGSLVASAADEPGPRETIVIRDSPSGTPSGTPTRSSSPSPGPSDEKPGGPGVDHSDDVEVIIPDPDDLDDGADDDGRDGDDGEDRSGPGGSDDDTGDTGDDDSGPGGGDDDD